MSRTRVLGSISLFVAAAALLAYFIRGTPPFCIDVRAARVQGGWDAVRAGFLAARNTPDLSGIRTSLAAAIRSALDSDPALRPDARTFAKVIEEALNHG